MDLTIKQKKSQAGWITNDVRKQRVSQGQLKPGHKDGQKCLCCKHFGGFRDRCHFLDIPTGMNAYCNHFQPKEIT